jgi:hypothetical protein
VVAFESLGTSGPFGAGDDGEGSEEQPVRRRATSEA